MATTPEGKELHVCAGLNACYQHGKSGTNDCAGTGDCATVLNDSCHGNNECRGQGGCGGGGSLGSQQTAPGENLCRGKGSCYVAADGIQSKRVMQAAKEAVQGSAKGAGQPITGIYEGRHVWQVARLLFEQRMIASGRTYTTIPGNLGPKPPADPDSATKKEFLYFGPPPNNAALGPGTTAQTIADQPLYANKKTAYGTTTVVGKKSS